MTRIIEHYKMEGPKLIEYDAFSDGRGRFLELANLRKLSPLVPVDRFVQLNAATSRAGVIRGLHWQDPPFGQGKLLWCLDGDIYDVVLDIRPDSPTFGHWEAVWLDSDEHRCLWVPPAGFAHGYATGDSQATILYAVTAPYSREHERSISPLDPELGIGWPIPLTSEKDANAQTFKQYRDGAAVGPGRDVRDT